MIHESNSIADTERVAGEIAQRLQPGICIALDGELGAGKTQFVRGLVRALGGDARSVSSPTYILLNIYACRGVQVFHLDAYRVAGADDLESIGFGELLDQGGITVIEWAARVRTILPKDTLQINLVATGETSRRIEVVE